MVLWLKTLHLVAAFAWMASLWYLPRLFVYHAQNIRKNEVHTVLCTMESRLFRMIGLPAMMVTWVAGIGTWHAQHLALFQTPWLVLKLSCVIGLTVFQLSAFLFLKQFSIGRCTHSVQFFRLYNEIPTLLLAAIVVAVVWRF